MSRFMYVALLFGITIHAMESNDLVKGKDKSTRSFCMSSHVKTIIPVNQEENKAIIDCSEIDQSGYDLLQNILALQSNKSQTNYSILKTLLEKTSDVVINSVQKQFIKWNISLDGIIDPKALSPLIKKLNQHNIDGDDLQQDIAKGHMSDLKISPDSTCFAATTINGTAKLWKPDGTLIEKIMDRKPSDVPANSIDMTPDKLTMVITGQDKTFVWQRPDQQSDGAISIISYPKNKYIHNTTNGVIRTSQNGTYIVLGLQYGQTDSEMQVWKVDSTKIGSFSKLWSQTSAAIGAIKVSSDGLLVYCPNPQKSTDTLALNLNDGSTYRELGVGNGAAITRIETLGNQNYIVSVDQNGGIAVFNFSTGFITNNLNAHNKVIRALAPTRQNSTQFATGSDDQTIKVWNFDVDKKALVLLSTLQVSAFIDKLQFGFGDKLLFGAVRDINTGNTSVMSGVTNSSDNVTVWDTGTNVWISDDNSFIIITLYPKGALILNSKALNEVLKIPTLLRAKLLNSIESIEDKARINSLVYFIEQEGYSLKEFKSMINTNSGSCTIV